MKFLLIVLTIIFSCSKKNIVMNSNISKLIYVEGAGGDYSGAKLIAGKESNIKIVNSIKNLIDIAKENPDSIEDLYLIGQNASNNFIKNTSSLMKFKRFFLYSHILDKNIISFLNDKKNSNVAEKITLITTKSQFDKVKNNKIKKYVSHRILKTIDYNDQNVIDQFQENEEEISEMLSRKTILLGGNYKNDNFDEIIIPLKIYTKKIKECSKRNKDLSIVIHPRFFSECKTDNQKAEKLQNFKRKLEKEKINPIFYLPTNILNAINNLLDLKIDIRKSPNFNAIMYGIEIKKLASWPVFSSSDQCNVSADDINNQIQHFSIDGNKDHTAIVKDAKQGSDSASDFLLNEIGLS